jgi:hypothetical protein
LSLSVPAAGSSSRCSQDAMYPSLDLKGVPAAHGGTWCSSGTQRARSAPGAAQQDAVSAPACRAAQQSSATEPVQPHANQATPLKSGMMMMGEPHCSEEHTIARISDREAATAASASHPPVSPSPVSSPASCSLRMLAWPCSTPSACVSHSLSSRAMRPAHMALPSPVLQISAMSCSKTASACRWGHPGRRLCQQAESKKSCWHRWETALHMMPADSVHVVANSS